MVKWAHFPPVHNKRAASDQCFCEEDNNAILPCNAFEVISVTNINLSFILSDIACFKIDYHIVLHKLTPQKSVIFKANQISINPFSITIGKNFRTLARVIIYWLLEWKQGEG